MSPTTRAGLRRQMHAVEQELDRLQEAAEEGRDVDGDEPNGRLAELAIDVDVVETVRVVFAIGGPGIRAEIQRLRDGEIVDVWLHGSWGAEKVEYRIARDTATWRALQGISDLVPTSA